jgi:hypothetical protein
MHLTSKHVFVTHDIDNDWALFGRLNPDLKSAGGVVIAVDEGGPAFVVVDEGAETFVVDDVVLRLFNFDLNKQIVFNS